MLDIITTLSETQLLENSDNAPTSTIIFIVFIGFGLLLLIGLAIRLIWRLINPDKVQHHPKSKLPKDA